MVENEIKYPEFAERLSKAMKVAGVTVTDLKNHLQVTYEMVRRYTMGVAMPRDERLVAIADRLEVEAAWLKFGDPSLEPKVAPAEAPKKKSWPLKLATLDRFYALTPAQAKQADAAIDVILRGFEADRGR